MAKEKKCNCEAGAPLWMVTYGDLMSLLLTFFVLLLSFSTITEEELFREAIQSFRGAVGFLPKELTAVQINPMPRRMRPPSRAAEELARRLRLRLQILGKEQDVRLEFDPQGQLRISLPNRVLFDTASAQLKPDSFPILNDFSTILADLPDAFFEVRGHTDNRPLTSTARFRDNHDLSVARADSVARYLAQVGRIPLDRFEITGAGPGQPVATNDTEEGMQANRRVEVTVKGLTDATRIQNLQERVQGLTNP